jgi:hypothetical protein
MKITFAKHGGQAAGIYLHLPPKVIDATAIAPEKATELAQLVAAAKASMQVREDKREHGADLMSYTITVEENGQPTLLRQSQTNIDPRFKALRDWLEEHPNQK